MFEEPKTSLSQLDQYEREWLLQFLQGTPWKELFETLEDGNMPPAWLVEWSSSWGTTTVFTIDEMDPYWSDGWLVEDSSNGERWFVVEECIETVSVFERISDDQALVQAPLKYLKGIGHFPILGRFQINPMWLPLSLMRAYLEDTMQDAGQTFLQGDPNLTVEHWLKREYQNDYKPTTAQSKQLR